jgi:DNA repair protein RadD
MILRNYQTENKRAIISAWNSGARYVLSVLPTGAGKTVIFSSILAESTGSAVAIAHRREILGQISFALAESAVPHAIIGPSKLARIFAAEQRERIGRSYINPNSKIFVASIDTLRAREASLRSWGSQVRLWIQDEAHHVLTDNKWGQSIDLFPNAVGLGVTATPLRADGRSLSHNSGGIFERLIQGPGLRPLINQGFLTDYRIYAPPSDMDLAGISVGSSGDYSRVKLAQAVKKSRVVGDVVEQYSKLAPGEKGVTFVPDVETAKALAGLFSLRGFPAAALSAKSTDDERTGALKAFRNGDLTQLVNVDLFGEGFDLPAIQVVSFARPTASYGLYCQQFGRVLRPFNGKTHGKIIDHAGNVLRHGLPDRERVWILDAGNTKRDNPSGPPLRTCERCLRLWEGYARQCPFCGYIQTIHERSAPEQVEGDLYELDPETLAQLRGDADRINAPTSEIIAPLQAAGAPDAAVYGLAARHKERQKAQLKLRDRLALWGGYARAAGLNDSARFIRFFREFGIDVLSAQALGRSAAEDLFARVNQSIERF